MGDYIIACPTLIPTGIADAAESAEAGRQMGGSSEIVISYDMKYEIDGPASAIYQSMWISALLEFNEPVGAGAGITSTYAGPLGIDVAWDDGGSWPWSGGYMGIELETYWEYDIGDDFALQFLISDLRMPSIREYLGGPQHWPVGHRYVYDNFENCRYQWLHVEIVVNAYGTQCTVRYRDQPGPVVTYGEWCDVPVCPMGEIGLPASAYSRENNLTYHAAPFNGVGFLEIDGLAWISPKPTFAEFRMDNFMIGSRPVVVSGSGHPKG